MKAIDFAVSRILPEDLRQPEYDLSKKGVGKLLAQVAERYPDKFREVSKKLGDLGRMAVWRTGYSTTAQDTMPVIDTAKYYAQMDAELAALRKEKLDPAELNERRVEIMSKYSDMIDRDTMRAATKSNNAFARAVASGARGNPAHIKAILSTPGLYQDASGRTIPLFVRNSFSGGVRPAELLAGTYGARSAVVSTKRATAKGGDLLKITTQNTSRYNITEKDCGINNGIDLPPDDDSLTGRVLARAAGDLPAGTVIDRQALSRIHRAGKPVIVRSTMTCKAEHGLCAKCAGLQADGKFPNLGDSIGITASAAINEPIVQASLNTKHNAGMAKGKKSFSGFDYVSQFVQIPDEFKDRAAVAEVDGVVEKVEDAPQGGKYVYVNGEQHFVLPGFDVSVKPGDKVEAGEQLSEGLVNPADVVRLRGLGEGRRYYADRLGQILADSGNPPDRRNMEILARAAVDNYLIDDPDEDDPWLPDTLVRESEFLRGYKPPGDTTSLRLDKAVGAYLQQPVLHYTVGTRLTPKMAERMRGAGVESVLASRTTPRFKPEMQRLRVASHDSDDWMTSLSTSYLSSQMRDALERGDETNIQENYHYAPRLAYGADAGKGGFGERITQTGKF